MMNWTGGRLQQSRRSSTAVTAKQRAYFARARARILNGDRSVSPPQFSLLNGSHAQVPWPTGGRLRSSRRPHSQRKLNDYADLAPTVKHLASITPRSKAQRSERGLSNNVKGQSSGFQPFATRGVAIEPQNPTIVPDQLKVTYVNGVLSQDSLERKRLELLQRSDWFEVPSIKPLKISFPSNRDREQIGRRRKLTKAEIEAHIDRVKRRKIEVLTRQFLPGHKRSSSSIDLDRDQVSVRIGDSIHGSQWTGVASAMQLKDIPDDGKEDEMLFSSEHSSQLSSIMLLDDGVNSKKLSPKQTLQSSQSVGVNSTPTMLLVNECAGQAPIRKNNASGVTTKGKMQDLITLESPAETESPPLRYQGSDREIKETAVDCSPDGTSRNPSNVRLIFSSQQLEDTSSNDSDTIYQAAVLPQSEQSIYAQASNSSEDFESNPDEEEWRGFLDISGSTDAALADEADDFHSQNDEISQKDNADHERVLLGMRRSSSPLEVSAYDDTVNRSELCMGLNVEYLDISAQHESTAQQDPAAKNPNDDVQPHKIAKQLSKDDTPDENKAWYKFVFGHELDDDETLDADKTSHIMDESLTGQPQPISISSPDPLVVQTLDMSSNSSTINIRPSLNSSLIARASSTPPPPSTHSRSLTSTACSFSGSRRILFQKPIPFTGRNPKTTTFRIGQAFSSSPLTRQARKRRRRLGYTESTMAEDGSREFPTEDEEDIED